MALTAEPLALLERDEAFATLQAAVDHAAGVSCGGLVLVSGEAGSGKTALLRQFCSRLREPVRVMWAGCDGLVTPRPLGPLLDISEITGGELEARVAAGDPPHDVAAALLRELASGGPAVLVLEDVHWADEATLDVVRLIARRSERLPVVLVLSYRQEQVARAHPVRVLLGELPRQAELARIELPGLSLEAVTTLTHEASIDPQQLHARTGGNPFFVTEILAARAEALPATVRDAVLARAARLSPAARAILDSVSVIPQRTELWLLEALADLDGGGLEECLAAGMLKAEATSVSFRHELARMGIEVSLPVDRRITLNRIALEALGTPPVGEPDLARLAHHAEAAGLAEAVLRLAPAAAERAAAVKAHREAAEQYARALRFAGPLSPAERVELLEAFGASCYLTDMRGEGIDALTEAAEIRRRAGDPVRLAETLRLCARLLGCAGRGPEARAAVEEALEVLGEDGPPRQRAWNYAARAVEALMSDEFDDTIAWGSRAIAVAEAVGDTEILVDALNTVGCAELLGGDHEGLSRLERSLALAEGAGLSTDVGRAYINIASSLARRRQYGLTQAYLTRGIEYCDMHGLEAWTACLLGSKAEAELARGDWTAAAAIATALVDGPSAHASARHDGLRVLALARGRRGDPWRWELLDEALQIAQEAGDPQYLIPTAAARAELAWLDGMPERIEHETQAAFASALDIGEAWALGELAVWRRRGGLLDELPDLLDAVPYALELAGDHRGAAAAWRDLGLQHEAALALAQSDEEELLRDAHRQLRELGSRPAAAIVARRLRAAGARNLPRGPRPSTQGTPYGLTTRQFEVLTALADGLSNAEIARRLVLSEKTVDHHVSAILGKLGARSRGQAVAEARKSGVLAAAPT